MATAAGILEGGGQTILSHLPGDFFEVFLCAWVIGVEGKPFAATGLRGQSVDTDRMLAVKMALDVGRSKRGGNACPGKSFTIGGQQVGVLQVEVRAVDEPQLVLGDHERCNPCGVEQRCGGAVICCCTGHCA